MSDSCHGAMARGRDRSVCSWIRLAIRAMHVGGGFLVRLGLLWFMRWFGRGGGCVWESLRRSLWVMREITGWLLFRRDRRSASISSLYSMYMSIGGMDASISNAKV